jgi:hypothetical protein
VLRYCGRCSAIVVPGHTHSRWRNPATGKKQWIAGWNNTKARAMAASGGMCTHPGCTRRVEEIHHVDDHHARGVCRQHHERGG